MKDQKNTGYPSIDKPWLKYYSEAAINGEIPKCTLYEYVYMRNKQYMHEIAIQYFKRKITYSEFFENIKKTAEAFWSNGVREGDVVTIMSLNTPETIYCIYALNYIGAVANMVYMTLCEEEIVETLNNTKSRMFVFLDIVSDKIQKITNRINVPMISISPIDSIIFPVKKRKINGVIYYKNFLKGVKESAEQAKYIENKLAVIVYTSGTTGKPKGVMLSNDNINAIVWQYEKSGIKFKREETFLTTIPPFLSMGLSLNIHLPLCLGTTNVMIINPENLVRQYKKIKPNHFIAGPVIIKKIVDNIDYDMKNCITMGGGGESLSIDEENKVNNILKEYNSVAKYLTGYGMTEFAATVSTAMNHVYKIGTLGIPLCKVNVKVIDSDSGNELKINEIGELMFCTPSSMIGYFRNEQETKNIISKDNNGNLWIHTGDLGYVDDDGFIHFCGRIKRIYLVQTRDENVYKIFPQRIEETIVGFSDIRTCAVIVKLNKQKMAHIIAYVKRNRTGKKNSDFIKSLEEYCREKLPEHSRPEKIIELDEIPLTQSGKIDYKTLENRYD